MECKWIVEETEHERGWGQRTEGFWIFENKVAADARIKAWHDAMPRDHVPDCYSSYNHVGWKPLGPHTQKHYALRRNAGQAYVFTGRYTA